MASPLASPAFVGKLIDGAPPSTPAKITCSIFAPLTTTRGSAYAYLPGLPGIRWIAEGFPAR